MRIERYKGSVVKIGDYEVRCHTLPGWLVCSVTTPEADLPGIREALRTAHQRIVNVKRAEDKATVFFEEPD